MTLIRTIVVDDEPDACLLLQSLLNDYENLQVKRTFTEPFKALETALAEQPDVIFLDIDMPELSGIEFLKKLNSCSPGTKVVFVSAHREYALEAIQNYAFDFITKPVDRQELRRVVNRLISGMRAIQNEGNQENVLLKTSEGYHYITAGHVLYMEAEGNYTRIFLNDESFLFSSVNMGSLFKQFPQTQFLRISRKHIVNKKYLTFFNFNKRQCTLTFNGKEFNLEVSMKLKDLKQHL